MNPKELLILLLHFFIARSKGNENKVQYVLIQVGETPHLGMVGSFSQPIPLDEEGVSGSTIQVSESNKFGCHEWNSDDINSLENIDSPIAIIVRGECTFVEKTYFAQKAGAKIVLVINDIDKITPMGYDDETLKKLNINIQSENFIPNEYFIPSIIVGSKFENSLKTLNGNKISIINHNKRIFDPTMIIMIFISTILVGLGSFYSSDQERSRFYNGSIRSFRQHQQSQEINTEMAWSFVIIASVGLLILFYFIQYIFYFVLLVFIIGATNGLTTIGSHIIEHYKPDFGKIVFNRFDIQLTKSDAIAMVPSFLLSAFWYFNRNNDNAWVLQDFMCIGLLMVLQRTIRLTNLKIATILLNMAFIYDIFWVFISPYFFTKSVMVEVATYSHTTSRDTLPVVLKFPRLEDPFHSPMILGLGDIALPGLLISYLLRFDYQSRVSKWKNGYFAMSLIGYCIGMGLTDINLVLMEHGQPALLFLVPCTLWIVTFSAWKNGHLNDLWNGNPTSKSPKYNPVKANIIK